MNMTIGTPEGTRDRLFAECAVCREVERAATQLFQHRGYSELTTPNLEYFDVISAAGHPMKQETMIKCVERTGKLLIMRPDNTVAIGRVAASKLSRLPLPLRLYYNQTVFRSDELHTGARTEIDQCGVELIGAEGLRADLEVLSMAVDALDACGLRDYHIEIGHVGFFAALLEALPLEQTEKQKLRSSVEKKDFVSYRGQLRKLRDTQEGRALWQLPRLFGGAEVLAQARALTREPRALAAIDYLEEIYQQMLRSGLGARIQFDLGLIQNMEYYTGIIFRGFVPGAGSNVISGGRYDRLFGQFGKDFSATGFGLDVEAVSGCLSAPEHKRPATIVWYQTGCLAQARALLDTLPVQSAMLSCQEEPGAAAEEAKNLGASRLILITEQGQEEVAL